MPNLIKIEFPSAIEIISARFDNALELADKDAMVFGGVIRDMLAGLPLEGDLDIIAAYDSYFKTLENFKESGKWVEESYARRGSPKISAGYRKNKKIGKTTTFKTFANVKVQLIQSTSRHTKDLFETNLESVKSVDIVCCGLIMDINGNIFEVLENAHNDCLNKILRLNKSKYVLSLPTLEKRIEKLLKRGWESKINLRKIKKMVNKVEEAKRKEQKAPLDINIKDHLVRVHKSKYFKSYIIVSRNITERLGDASAMATIAARAARKADIQCKILTENPRDSLNIPIYVRTAKDVERLEPALIREIGEALHLVSTNKHSYYSVPKFETGPKDVLRKAVHKVSRAREERLEERGLTEAAVSIFSRSADTIDASNPAANEPPPAASTEEVSAWDRQNPEQTYGGRLESSLKTAGVKYTGSVPEEMKITVSDREGWGYDERKEVEDEDVELGADRIFIKALSKKDNHHDDGRVEEIKAKNQRR